MPAGSRVILCAGLPGDAESESQYRQQLQDWLDWLASLEARPRQVYVLWDDPGTLRVPGGLSTQVTPARRDALLDLGKTLGLQTNTLLFVLWGHGGKQGSTPVYHVRGPRIAPGDLKALAEQMPSADSRWILFFRGSGAFARELAGTRRQVIASESETPFTNDPVGLPLLLKLLRADAARSFAAVAEAFGPAVALWYEERNLARTEEPTLWLPGAAPRRLASDSALAPSRPATDAPPVSPPVAERPPPPAVPAELAAVWREIKRVEPARYPDADAVILRRRVSLTLGSSPALGGEREEFVQILTLEGKERGDFDVPYSPPHEEIEFLDCEVLGPEGKVVRLDPDAIRESAEESVGDYRAGRRKFFSLPGVVPGAVLHVRYRTSWKTFPMPHVSLALPVADDLPLLDSAIRVTVPKDAAFHYSFGMSPSIDPAIEQTAHGTTYVWAFPASPAWPHEALAPPQLRPALLISTFPSWAAFAEWYARITQLTDALTPELTAKARELTRGLSNDRDRVRALYEYVARLRYVAVPLGINSLRPHAAASVLQNQFGDCKDKANLFNTLLRALDFEARLVLVPRFSQAYSSVPGLAFNHAISRVTVGGETWWVDTTDDVCRFGMLPPGDAGRNVLVIDGKTAALTPLPLPGAAEHRLEVRAQVKCRPAGAAADVEYRVRVLGFPDYALRQAARAAQRQAKNVPLLESSFRLAAGTFGLARQASAPVSQLDEAFTWEAGGQCFGLLSGEGPTVRLQAPFWLPDEWSLALHARTTPLFLNHGYPLMLDEEIEFELPADAQAPVLPAAQEGRGEPLSWSVAWTQTSPRTVRARLQARLVQGEVAGPAVAMLQAQVRQLLTSLTRGAKFTAQLPSE